MRSVTGVLVALAVVTAYAAFAEPSPYLSLVSATWVKRPSGPGDVGVVRLSVAAYGVDTLMNAKARVSGAGGCSVAGGGEVLLGSMGPGAPKSFDVAINFSGDPCYLSVLVEYEASAKQTAAGYSVSTLPGSLSLNLRLDPVYEPRFAVSISPSSLNPNTVNNVTVTVANTGYSDIKTLDVSVSVSGAALLDSANPVVASLGVLPAGEVRSLKLRLLPTSPVATLSVKLSYADASGSYGESAFSYSIPVGSSALLVSLEPQALPSASSTPALLVVRNLGGETVKNATIYFTAQPGSSVVIEPSTVRVGDAEPGGTLKIPVTVKVPYGERGARSVPFTLVYRGGDGGLRVVRDSVAFVAVEEAKVAITAIEVAPAKPTAGSVATVSVTLMNLGSSPVYGVNVTVALPEGLAPVRSSYYFIGQLTPYTPTAVPFSLRVEQPGSYRVSVRIDYTGYYGEPKFSIREVTFEAGAAAATGSNEVKQSGNGGLALGLAVGAVLAVAGNFAYRRVKRGEAE
jgi:uncharacterized repeat protein (TIGR01451 family)